MAGLSPTLSLKVTAPQAIQQFTELTAAAAGLRAELAALNTPSGGGGGGAGMTALKAQVAELTAGLRTAQATVEALQKQVQASSVESVRQVRAEEAAVKAAEKAKQTAVKETVRARKEAESDAAAHAEYLHKVQLQSALMTGRDSIARGAASQSLLQGRDYQSYLENHRQEMAVRATAALQTRAMLENEARTRATELAQRREGAMQYRALAENEARTRADALAIQRAGAVQARAEAENEARARAAELALRREGAMQYRALTENEARTKRVEADQRRAGVLQARALSDNEKVERDREMAERRMALLHMKALADNEIYDREKAGNGVAAAREAALAKRKAMTAAERAEAAQEAEQRAAQAGAGRSAIRGAAAAGGGMFLTYGQNIPALAATFGAGMAIKESIQDGAEFQKTMAFVKIASDDTVESVRKVGNEILDMGGKVQFGPLEMAKGMRILTQAGLSTADAMKVLQPSMQLAVLGETDVGKAAETATGLMHAFGLEVQDFRRIGDVIVKAANLSQTNVSEMSEAMKQSSTVAKQYNVSIEEMGALLGVLAQRNIRGSAAGTALMNMFRELDPHTTRARRAFQFLGVQVEDLATGKMKPIIPLLQEFAKEFAKLSDMDQNRVADDYLNNRGAKAFINNLAEANKSLPEFYGKLQLASRGNGMMAESFNILANTASGAWDRFKSGLESSLIKASQSDKLIDPLERLTRAVTDPQFVDGIALLVSGFTSLTSLLVEHGGSIAGIVGSYMLFSKILPGIATGSKNVVTSIEGAVAGSTLVAGAGGIAMMAKNGGLLGLALFGGWSIGSYIAKINGVTTAIGDFLEMIDPWKKKGIDVIEKGIAEQDNTIKLMLERGVKQDDPRLAQARALRFQMGAELEAARRDFGLPMGGRGNRSVGVSKEDPGRPHTEGSLYETPERSGGPSRKYDRIIAEEEAAKNALADQRAAQARISQRALENDIKRSQQALDAKHRYGLVSEADYNSQVEMLQDYRTDKEIELSRKAEKELLASIGSMKKRADQIRGETQLLEIQARTRDLIADAQATKAIRAQKAAADEKKITEDAHKAQVGYLSDLDKIHEQQVLKRRRDQEAIEDATSDPRQDPGRAQGRAARLAVESAYLGVQERLQKEIAELEQQATPAALKRLDAIYSIIPILERQRDIEMEIAESAARANHARQREFEYGWRSAYKSYVESATDAAQNARDVFGVTTKGMEDAIIKFSKTGKLSFREFASSVIDELLRIQARKTAAGLMGLLGNVIPGLGGTGFGGGAALALLGGGMGTTPGSQQSQMLAAQVLHSGGIVGSSSASTRMVPDSTFGGAQRYHGGGIVPGERPVIAQHGEGVFTPEQMSRLAPVGAGMVKIDVEVNMGGTDNVNAEASDGAALGQRIAQVTRGVIQQEKRPGGLLSRV